MATARAPVGPQALATLQRRQQSRYYSGNSPIPLRRHRFTSVRGVLSGRQSQKLPIAGESARRQVPLCDHTTDAIEGRLEEISHIPGSPTQATSKCHALAVGRTANAAATAKPPVSANLLRIPAQPSIERWLEGVALITVREPLG